jgi:hypothetical protein
LLEIESRCLGQTLQGLEANHVRVRLALADHQPTTRLYNAAKFFERALLLGYLT